MKLVQSTYHVLCVDNNRDNCSILNIRGEKKQLCIGKIGLLGLDLLGYVCRMNHI